MGNKRELTRTQIIRNKAIDNTFNFFCEIEMFIQGNLSHGSLWWNRQDIDDEEIKIGAGKYGIAVLAILDALNNSKAARVKSKLLNLLEISMVDWRTFIAKKAKERGAA